MRGVCLFILELASGSAGFMGDILSNKRGLRGRGNGSNGVVRKGEGEKGKCFCMCVLLYYE